MNAERDVAIVDEIFDTDCSEQPFGKRWGRQLIKLGPLELAALLEGKLLALDVNGEYVAYLKLEG